MLQYMCARMYSMGYTWEIAGGKKTRNGDQLKVDGCWVMASVRRKESAKSLVHTQTNTFTVLRATDKQLKISHCNLTVEL